MVMTGASAIVGLIGVRLLFTGAASQGVIATASGVVSGTGFWQLTREASEQKEKVNERLDKMSAAIIERDN